MAQKNKSLDMMVRMGMINESPLNKPKGNFLSEYRENTNNTADLVAINELNAKSLISRHSKDGYCVVSPCRGYADFGLTPDKDKEKLANINRQRVKDIIELIKDKGFSYTPVYGGFVENQGEDNEEVVYERSFIIYPFTKGGERVDFTELKAFAVGLGKRFNQDSVLVKEPNAPARYVDKDGNTDFELGDNVVFNDIAQTYFTDLHKNTGKFGDISNRKPTRFSYIESYINPAPQCLSERHCRHLNLEIFLSE